MSESFEDAKMRVLRVASAWKSTSAPLTDDSPTFRVKKELFPFPSTPRAASCCPLYFQ